MAGDAMIEQEAVAARPLHSCRHLVRAQIYIRSEPVFTCAWKCERKRIRQTYAAVRAAQQRARCPHLDAEPDCPLFEEWDGRYDVDRCYELCARIAEGWFETSAIPAWLIEQYHWLARAFGLDAATIERKRKERVRWV